ncbi:Protein arginine N-methyltransferase 1 [Sphaceloma murrayae]|uniref:DNA (cytosine-5-)-methyltransferase n=1 Tax=Sphaceloma murrayae TaxID=2082308 RepID=A0A2K1QGW4_9PEZI|nr:Protein arginine N-methyltransferase 1 [Sphaceloma murrayae]
MPPIRGHVRHPSSAPQAVPGSALLPFSVPDDEIPEDGDFHIGGERAVVTDREEHPFNASVWRRFPRARTIAPTWIATHSDHDTGLARGDVVKLAVGPDFLQIRKLYLDSANNNRLILLGVRFRPLTPLEGGRASPERDVALVQLVFTDSIATRSGLYFERFTDLDVDVDQKVSVRFTNKITLSERQRRFQAHYPPFAIEDQSSFSDGTHLTCRDKYTLWLPGSSNGTANRAVNVRKLQEEWVNLTEAEADLGHRVKDGAFRDKHNSLLSRRRTGRPGERDDGRYRMMDACCGAGFVTQGAKAAGARVVSAFDFNRTAIRSYRKNHTDTASHRCDFAEFYQQYAGRQHVHLLHISPPCQRFSPCHTRDGRDDEANEVLMLGLGDLIAKQLPPYVMIEQTSGLDFPRWRKHLMAVIAALRDNHYSVRKFISYFGGYGVPTTRKRLIIYAAAPGHPLPDNPEELFNRDVRNLDHQLHNAVTVGDALAQVDVAHPNHDLRPTTVPLHMQPRPLDPYTYQAATMTTGRCRQTRHNLHPDGTRLLTSHERMLCQGEYGVMQIEGTPTEQWRQIGNAVPPIAAERLVRSVIERLDKTKKGDTLAEHRQRQASHQPAREKQSKLRVPPMRRPVGSSGANPITIDPEDADVIVLDDTSDDDVLFTRMIRFSMDRTPAPAPNVTNL